MITDGAGDGTADGTADGTGWAGELAGGLAAVVVGAGAEVMAGAEFPWSVWLLC